MSLTEPSSNSISLSEHASRSTAAEYNEMLPHYIGLLELPGGFQLEPGHSPSRYIKAVLERKIIPGANGTSERVELRLAKDPKKTLYLSFLPMATANTHISLTGDWKQMSRIPGKTSQAISATDAQLLFVFDGSLPCANAPSVSTELVKEECKNFARAITCLERFTEYIATQISEGNPLFECSQTHAAAMRGKVRQAEPQLRKKEEINAKVTAMLRDGAYKGFKVDIPELDSNAATEDTESANVRTAKRVMYLSYPLASAWRDDSPKGEPDLCDPQVAEFIQELNQATEAAKAKTPPGKRGRRWVHSGYPICAVVPPGILQGASQDAFQRLVARNLVLQPQFTLSVKLSSPKYPFALSLTARLLMLVGKADHRFQLYQASTVSKKCLDYTTTEYTDLCQEFGIVASDTPTHKRPLEIGYSPPSKKQVAQSNQSPKAGDATPQKEGSDADEDQEFTNDALDINEN